MAHHFRGPRERTSDILALSLLLKDREVWGSASFYINKAGGLCVNVSVSVTP